MDIAGWAGVRLREFMAEEASFRWVRLIDCFYLFGVERCVFGGRKG